MQYRKLGKTDLEVSVVGMGGWAIGGLVEHWGPVDDNESIAAVREGIELGINLIDTAPSYGYGHSEEIIGRAIAGMRDRVVVATHCGLVWQERGGKLERNLRPESIRRECEASLRRLRVDTIDLYQMQWPDTRTPVGQTLQAMTALRDEGKIRVIGASNLSVEQLAEARRYGAVESFQPELSLLERSAVDDLMPYCREYGIGLVTCGSLARGMLTGKFDASTVFSGMRASDPCFEGEAFRRRLRAVDRLRGIAAEVGRTPAQVALRWAIQQTGVSSAIVGVKRASQVRENAIAGDFELPAGIIDQLDRLGGEEA